MAYHHTRKFKVHVLLMIFQIFLKFDLIETASVPKDIKPNRALSDDKKLLPNVNSDKDKLIYGTCHPNDSVLHSENIRIENDGRSTLSGLIEFHIGDNSVKISCLEIWNLENYDNKSDVMLHSGGQGHNWFFIDVKGKYGKGMNVFIKAYGK